MDMPPSTAAFSGNAQDTLQDDRYQLPLIVPYGTEMVHISREFDTKFQDKTYSIQISINRSVYEGARRVDKSWPPFGRWDSINFTSSYYASYLTDPQVALFYDELMKNFHQIRARDGLNEEEYIELLVTFVQQIPYDESADEYPRYPIEVVYDRTGDCDEKSLLLLGMLSHEGYDVALLLFPDERHAVAGIRIKPMSDTSFRIFRTETNQKYFYIETTVVTYIGLYPEEYETASAYVVPLGSGKISYNRVNYITYITDTYAILEKRLVFMDEQLSEWDISIRTLERRLKTGVYDTQEEYDIDYSQYFRLISQYNDYVIKYNQCHEVYQYISDHAYDVAGVYRRIENSKVRDMEY